MNSTLQEIADLFPEDEVPRDETGCLAAVAGLLGDLGPRLLVIADRNGKLLAAETLASGVEPRTAGRLIPVLGPRLTEEATCAFSWSEDSQRGLAFGVRLGRRAQRAILGGLLAVEDPRPLAAAWPALGVCGELAWHAARARSERELLRTRIRQLLAEEDTLKASHTAAVTAALEESERRHRERHRSLIHKRRRQAAEAANRAKGRFLTTISHELRSPLHGMLSFAAFGFQGAETAPREDLQDYFHKIERSGGVILKLIDDLLDLAKMEVGKAGFRFAPVRLLPMIRRVVDEFGSRAADRKVEIELSPNAFNGSAVADEAKLMQVVRNLLSNALKFAPEHSTVEIRLTRDDPWALLSVLDRGPGIPEHELDAVFRQFVQSSTASAQMEGTGLGLAICREIIAAHRGRIWAQNRPGGGAEFTFQIPLEPDSTSRGESTAAGQPGE